MSKVEVNGIKINYEVEGDGPPLLLIAGLASSSLAWTALLPMLTKDFTCITFDNRGTGQTDVPEGPYTIDQMADDAAGLIEHLGLGPVNVVGWSLGGSVLQSLLIRHGHLLKRAVLLSAFPSYTPVQQAWLDASLILRREGLDPVSLGLNGLPWGFSPKMLFDHDAAYEMSKLALGDPYPTTFEGFAAQAEGLRNYDSRPDLPKVTTPTLVLVGAEDVLTPPSQSVEISELAPSATLQVLPRGGHGMVLEYPVETIGAITSYLSAGGAQ